MSSCWSLKTLLGVPLYLSAWQTCLPINTPSPRQETVYCIRSLNHYIVACSRGDWLGNPANIKVENHGAVGYVGSSLPCTIPGGDTLGISGWINVKNCLILLYLIQIISCIIFSLPRTIVIITSEDNATLQIQSCVPSVFLAHFCHLCAGVSSFCIKFNSSKV